MVGKPILIIGGGGHASVLVDVLLQQKRDILGIFAPEFSGRRRVFEGIPCFSDDDEILQFGSDEVLLVNGIGGTPYSSLREAVDTKFRSLGFRFEAVIDCTARVSDHSLLCGGVQVLANSTVQTGATVGRATIINTGALVEHDTFIGEHVHIAPGAVLAGGVSVGNHTFIGANAVVIEGVNIGSHAVIGAGATVVDNVESSSTYICKSEVVLASKKDGH